METTPAETSREKRLPAIDCVVIGVNAAATLERCLASIFKSDYPDNLLKVIYVDGGSHDSSIAIAKQIPAVHIIALHPEYPTPGLGRNGGWKAGDAPFVQFLDSDTILDPSWLRKGVAALEDDIAAVKGNRLEIHPEHSVFNWIGSLEWNGEPGESESFGGDVLVRRQALEESRGYDEELVGGEDPELSRRIRFAGWRILHLDTDMTRHDLAMTTIRQYWKRAYRSGYAFAAVIDRFADTPAPFWKKELRRIIVRGGGFVICTLLGLICSGVSLFWLGALPPALIFMCLGLLLLFFPRIFRVKYFQEDKKISHDQAKVYAWHCSLVVVPDIFGVCRFHLGKLLNRPLRNKRSSLATAGM
jgi:cellulose synthase/poly-beta-1,6-N-acetylglucosamine synthase-like glycosyltransferase